MTDEQRRLQEVCELMDKRLREMTPQERDDLLQLHIAAAMTKEQRLKAIADMTDLMLALRRARASQEE